MAQLPGSIMQIAYVVDDLEAAVRRWTQLTGAGPFFLLEHLNILDPRYRGQPTDIDCSIALGYSGSICVELIQQHNDSPSAFGELVARTGGGFHHWAVMTEQFDADVARYRKQGYVIAFSGAVAVGGRFAYMDTVADLGGMIELIELTPPVRELFDGIEKASGGWDGRDPIRRF